jgi:hypothetical protein
VLRVAGLVLAIAAVLGTGAESLAAQGFPGGGGMGGMGGGGRRGGMGGGGRAGGGAPAQRGPSGDDIAKQMEELASLKDAMHKVPDLSNQQKDSVKALEHRYGEVFKSYGIAARNMVDTARADGGMGALRTLREQADSVRTAEFTLARAVLTSDSQRTRFDQNVAEVRAEQVKREEEMRQRRSGGMGRGGMGGGGMRP